MSRQNRCRAGNTLLLVTSTLVGLITSTPSQAYYANGYTDVRINPQGVEQARNGAAVAALGDLNGDGYTDFATSAPNDDFGGILPGAGGLSVFLGTAERWVTGRTAHTRLFGTQTGEAFASAVAGVGDLNGDGYADFAVGAPMFDLSGANDAGRVRVYFGQPNGIPALAGTLLGVQAGGQFGYAVAAAGDLNGDGYADLLVGAPLYDDTGRVDSGQAQIFLGGAGTSFDNTADAAMAPTAAGSRFGTSVASAGDFNGDGFADFVVGVPSASLGQTGEGAGLLYLGVTGTIDTIVDLTFESDQAGAALGVAIAAGGDVNGDGYSDVVLGAPRFDDVQSDEGAAFVYFGGMSPDSVRDQILQFDVAGELVGSSLDLADTNGDGYADLGLGVPAATDFGIAGFGKARIITGGSSGLGVDMFDVRGSYTTTNAGRLGTALAFADYNADGFPELLIGAPNENAPNATGQGAAYLVRSNRRLATAIDASLPGLQPGAQQGYAMATGDLNGDGLSDLVVGQPLYDQSAVDTGRVEIYYGTLNGLDPDPDLSLIGAVAHAQFGRALVIGDFNRDGYGDLAIGAPTQTTNGGEVHLYLGSASALDTTVDRVLSGPQIGAQFGDTLANAGDMTGDGYPELVVGAPLADVNGTADAGIAYFYRGDPAGLSAMPQELRGSAVEMKLGRSLAASGDVNGDGFNDLAVGSKEGASDDGRVRILFGAESLDMQVDQIIDVGQSGGRCSEGLAGAGDFDGDGYSDLVVGCPGPTQASGQEGFVGLYRGGFGLGLSNQPAQQFLTTLPASEFGRAIIGGGDIDGDGYADVVIGQPAASTGGRTANGALRWQLGSPDLDADSGTEISIPADHLRLGSALAMGDFDGDGFADIAVGAPGATGGAASAGSVHIISANGPGRTTRAQQFRSVSVPLDFNTGTSADNRVAIAMTGQGTRGSERARLEARICPNMQPFDDLNCQTTYSDWFELPREDPSMVAVASFPPLLQATTYRWAARLQFAAITSQQAGIMLPEHIANVGPWRRMRASAELSDLRTTNNVLLSDGFE
ncbi:FG-GAP-like repeat-containing protein [Ahniella affigens]|nr:FG-GAP-like repeat-containing protein [Ahniella affigens]